MIGLLQRVREARVEVEGQVVGQIGPGLLALVCAERGDTEMEADKWLAKALKLRIFSDPPDLAAADAEQARLGKMNRSLQDVGGGLLLVSQFTLAADTSGGNRPSFSHAAPPEDGRRLYEYLVARARQAHPQVATGQFAADMQVHLVNDGPVTVPLRVAPAAATVLA